MIVPPSMCYDFANAVHHATGKRVRVLPITLDKLTAVAGRLHLIKIWLESPVEEAQSLQGFFGLALPAQNHDLGPPLIERGAPVLGVGGVDDVVGEPSRGSAE